MRKAGTTGYYTAKVRIIFESCKKNDKYLAHVGTGMKQWLKVLYSNTAVSAPIVTP